MDVELSWENIGNHLSPPYPFGWGHCGAEVGPISAPANGPQSRALLVHHKRRPLTFPR